MGWFPWALLGWGWRVLRRTGRSLVICQSKNTCSKENKDEMGGLGGGEGGDRSVRQAEGGEGETQRLQRVGGDPRGRSRQRTSWVPGHSGMCQSAGGEKGREAPGTGRGDWNREAGGPSIPNPSTTTHFLSGRKLHTDFTDHRPPHTHLFFCPGQSHGLLTA